MKPTDEQLNAILRADIPVLTQREELRRLFQGGAALSPRLEIASRIMAGFAAVPEATATPLNVVVEGALCWADALVAADRESSK